MKIKYLGDRENFTLKDGIVFKKKGDVKEVDMDIDDFNTVALFGATPIFDIIYEEKNKPLGLNKK